MNIFCQMMNPVTEYIGNWVLTKPWEGIRVSDLGSVGVCKMS